MMAANDDDTTNDSRSPPYPNNSKKRRGGGPPSLLHLTTQIVATNIEKYPAGLWGVLSESQWDHIVRARVAQKKPKKKSPDGGTKQHLLPPLSAKHLTLIEQHPNNTHLAKSSTSDELLWKHILNYKFRDSSNSATGMMNMNRPTSLSVPCGHVERQLGECAETLIRLTVDMKSCSYSQFVADEQQRQQQQQQQNNHGNNNELLFGEDDDSGIDSDHDEKDMTHNDDEVVMHHKYQQFMKQLANVNLETLKRTCYTLSESPMDVQLLSETKIGKSVSKAVKLLTKLKRKCDEREKKNNRGFCCGLLLGEDVELREIFWKRVVKWNGPIICYTSIVESATTSSSCCCDNGQKNQMNQQRDRREVVELTPLELLEKLLDDWKEMASDSGVAMHSNNVDKATAINAAAAAAATTTPPKKKRRMDDKLLHQGHDNTNEPSNNKYTNIRVTTCGRDKHITLDQHLTDMKLLHNSPDWRSLYVSLTNRELELRKSHGEKVRATREHLERDRPKIGKVILKRAVGRVRGGDVGLGGGSVGLLRRDSSSGGGGEEEEETDLLSSSRVSTNLGGTTTMAMATTATKLSTFAADRKASRQEAILNKSKGLRAIQKQRAMGVGYGSTSSTKVAQIRQTSKVAAKWSKSSFGNSVASAAGSKSGVRKVGMHKEQAQVQVTLQNGKTMKLPSASTACGKSTGKFSSLHEKMTVKNRAAKKRK